jgi:hypothetical protein
MAMKANVKPAGGAGFAGIRRPDDALIEVTGRHAVHDTRAVIEGPSREALELVELKLEQ